ncbi:MAG: hypothetical protein UH239_07800 [Acutalibacteraceae bacterium]|nr:hypothetical protein [Acutalibacteraceae bacterium]
MKYMDTVELIMEKDKYAKEGLHKGMQGWICDKEKINDSWLVNFPQCGEKEDIATLGIKETDLREIETLNATINEEIKKQFK